MKIFSAQQISLIDKFTISNEPVSEINLIKRAAGKLDEWIKANYSDQRTFHIFAGPGNNGGDAIALAKLLAKRRKKVNLFLLFKGERAPVHIKSLLDEAKGYKEVEILDMSKYEDKKLSANIENILFKVSENGVIVDGIFGCGLNKGIIKGTLFASIIALINSFVTPVISIDIPSGLYPDLKENKKGDFIIEATHTLTFEFPKITFFLKESYKYTGEWVILPIGLHKKAIKMIDTPYCSVHSSNISSILKPREKFANKGDFGHGLMIAGSLGMAGAAVLAAKGALKGGVGLLTMHVPSKLTDILQISVPEAMCSIDKDDSRFSGIDNIDRYNAVGIGPGLTRDPVCVEGFRKLLELKPKNLIIDADGINILSEHPDLMEKLPKGTILTPHYGEFERLAGKAANSTDRIKKQKAFSLKHHLYIALKGYNTTISTPDGRVAFNTTGNPGMATGGSGDVLSGLILSLLAQGYHAENAVIAGVFIHGLAGDIAAEERGEYSVLASNIAKSIGPAIMKLLQH